MSAAPPDGTDADALDYAAEIAAMVLDTLGLRAFDAREAAIVADRIAGATGLARERVAALPAFGASAVAGGGSSEVECRVFASYFGEERAAAMREGATSSTLAGFAARFGDAGALLLGGLLVEVSRVDGHTSGEELGRLQAAAAQLGIDGMAFNAILHRDVDAVTLGGGTFALGVKNVLLGSDSACDVVLPHPNVAPIHAELVPSGEGWRVVSRHQRPTAVDGVVVASAPLHADAIIGIGPYNLRFEGTALVSEPLRPSSSLLVRSLHRKLGDQVLLQDVNFTAFTGELIALVGPSGSGKSTLLDAISGVAPADSGDVWFDGEPFLARLAREPSLVAHLPQDDLVLPELTVEECLLFAGRLRAGASQTREETQARAIRVMTELGIDTIRGRRVGDALRRGISGGQRKRVNLGQELMSSSTRVLFLDEPTSGLDPRAARDIVRIARRLADQGRIVFLVTHELGPGLMAQVDQLLLLVQGGRVAWYGPPTEGCAWIGVGLPEAIFDRIGDRTPERWAAKYRASEGWRTHVGMRSALSAVPTLPELPPRRAAPWWRTLVVVVERYVRVKARDRVGLMVTVLQPLLLAGVMALVFRKPTTPLLFMTALSALWFGMSGAVRELFSDRALWLRERRVGVGVFTYVGGKVLVLAGITAAQCVGLTGLVFASSGLGSAGFSFVGLAGICVLNGWAGMALGLLVSAALSSTEAAIGMLVLLLIPQIAFSGILMPLGDMSAPARALSTVIVQRYALDAALRAGDTVQYQNRTEWQERPTAGDLYLHGLRPSGEPPTGYTPSALVGILSSFTVLQVAAAAALVARRRR